MNALKACEDGSGDLILRLTETAGQDTHAVISLLSNVFAADFGHNQIKTFRIGKTGVTETNFLEGLV